MQGHFHPLNSVKNLFLWQDAFFLNLGQFVAFAAWIGIVSPTVGLVVADKFPFGGIPFQRLAGEFFGMQVGNVAQVAHGHAAGTGFDGAVRCLAAADAIHPILAMARVAARGWSLVEMYLAGFARIEGE